MTVKEFKDRLTEELRTKYKKDSRPTPILDRLDLHLKEFEGYDSSSIISEKNIQSDVYLSMLLQICYPSRIKMDIDENYQPITKKRIAIVSCKSKKKDYTCSADEMYSPSPVYRAQKSFCIKGYDDYYIISSEYGIIHHTQIIKPYNRAIKVSWVNPSDHHFIGGYKEGMLDLIHNQIKWMKDQGWSVDFHTSRTYLDPLLPETKQKLNYIKQPVGPGAIQQKYEGAYTLLDRESLKKCNEFISLKSDKPKEAKKWFFHPLHKSHYGTSGTMLSAYKEQELNSGAMYKVSLGQSPQSRGWVIDESLLPNLYQTESGQWRLRKQK